MKYNLNRQTHVQNLNEIEFTVAHGIVTSQYRVIDSLNHLYDVPSRSPVIHSIEADYFTRHGNILNDTAPSL